MAKETKGLLLGESAGSEVLARINNMFSADKHILTHTFPKTMHFGPESILVIVEVQMVDALTLHDAKTITKHLRTQILKECPHVSQVYISLASE